MGHTSTRAALIYLHSTSERQHTLADTVGKLARAQMRQVRKRADDGVSGPKGPADAGLVSERARSANTAADLGFPVSAPGRTRTCDPLLRRQLLYPTELRAPGTTLCMPKVTCRPQAGSLCIAMADPIDPALTAAEESREICSPHPRQPAPSLPWPRVRPKSGRRAIRRSPSCRGPPPGGPGSAQVAQGAAASARSGPDQNHEIAVNYHSGHHCRALLTIRKAWRRRMRSAAQCLRHL